MKIIKLLIRNSLVTFIISSVSAVAAGLSLSGMIYMINQGIDTKMADPNTLIIQFFGLWIVYGVTSVVAVYSVTRAAQTVILQMRMSISQKILQSSFAKLENRSDKILTVLTTDISTISNAINRLPNSMTGVATVLGCFVYMIWLSPTLMGMFSVVIFIAYILNKIPLQSYKERMRTARNLQSEVFALFEGLVQGLKELNLNKGLRKSFLKDLLKPTAKAQKKQNLVGRTRLAIFNKSGEMVIMLGIGSILLLVSIYNESEFAVMAQFLIVAMFSIGPLSRLGNTIPQLSQMNVALEKIDEIGISLDESAKEKNALPLQAPDKSAPFVKMDDVTYEYFISEEDKHFVLGPINIELNQGELIFLVGGNGSGKSTLAKVICGLYQAKTGEVSSFGEVINPSNVDAYREQFNAIFTDYYLFNHFYHLDKEKVNSKINEYIKLLELENKVQFDGAHLSTTSLSTGQRKRLALLISMLEDKPFYIFDEWAATQDPYYKDVYYTKILPDLKKQGKTVLVISHDDRYFNIADKILVLRDGKLSQSTMDSEKLVYSVYNVQNS